MPLDIKVLRFLFAGSIAAIFEFIAFALLTFVGVDPLYANGFSFVLGILTSFALNKQWVFKTLGKTRTRFIQYSLLACVNLGIGSFILHLLIYEANTNELFAKVVIMGMIALWNYLLFSKIIFKPEQERD